MITKKLFTAGIFGIFLSLGLSAHAATINVSPTASSTTIQAGIDAAAPGDTIEVAAGLYLENVNVNKSVILHGASTTSIVDGGGLDATFSVTANDVTIDGFRIQGGQNNRNAGVWVQTGITGLTIQNNLITDNTIGVYAQCGGNCHILNNVFDANDRPGAAGGSGIYTENTTGLTIDGNEFKNHTVNNPVIFGTTACPSHSNVVFTNNNVHDNISGVYVLAVNGGTFAGNTISAPGATGLSFSGCNNNVTISGNTITGSARGIRIDDSNGLGRNSNFTLGTNTFSGNTQYNARVEGDGYDGSLMTLSTPVITTTPFTSSTSPVTINGTTDASTTVNIMGGASTTAATVTGTNWTASVALTPNSVNHLFALSFDGSENTSSSSNVVDVTFGSTSTSTGTTTPPTSTTTPPTIHVNGDTTMHVAQNSTFQDPGATATSASGTPVAVSTSGSVNTSTPGTYTLVYTATDSNGNTAQATRTVIVDQGLVLSNGGGRGSTTVIPGQVIITPVVITPPVGQVLGAATFFFSRNLTIGSRGADVTELQSLLTREGIYSGPITGYFGVLTRAAVKTYQARKGIITTGYVGPLTRAALNADEAGSPGNSAAIQALKLQIMNLIQQLIAILQAQLQQAQQ